MKIENLDALMDAHLEDMLVLALSARKAEEAEPEAWSEADEASSRRAWEAFTRRWEARERELRRQKRRRALRRAVQAAACVVLALGVAGPIAFATNAAFRSRVMKLFMETTPEYTALRLGEDAQAAFDVPEGWSGEWYMSYIPEGYVLETIVPDFSDVIYVRPDDTRLDFSEADEDVEMNINTEDAEIRYVDVNGRRVMLATRVDTRFAVWSTDDRYFVLIADNTGDPAEERELLDVVAGVRRIIR